MSLMRISLSVIRRRTAAVLVLGLFGVASCDTPPTPPPDPGSVRLVVCPTTVTRTTQALIGPLGGLLSLDGTTIGIPSGALSLPTLITLTIPASQFMEIEVRANDLTSFVFRRDVGIRIDYSRCTDPALNSARLSVWEIDPQTKALLEFMGGTDNKSLNTISFSTGHLSAYAIAF
jgi:hypothetical protein